MLDKVNRHNVSLFSPLFYLIISHLMHFVTRAKIKALQNAELLNMLL